MMDAKLLVAAALCAAFSLNAEAKLFKWVDKNGTTHYGETIPPEYADRNAVKLDKGRIEQRNEKLEGGKQKDTKDPAIERARIEAERHDNALLNTYSSEAEIDLARDRNLQQVAARSNGFSMLLKTAQENLTSLQQELDARTKQGREIPQSLKEDIANAKDRVTKTQNDLDSSLKEQEEVKARYEADKARYRLLKSGAVPEASKPGRK